MIEGKYGLIAKSSVPRCIGVQTCEIHNVKIVYNSCEHFGDNSYIILNMIDLTLFFHILGICLPSHP